MLVNERKIVTGWSVFFLFSRFDDDVDSVGSITWM